MTEKTRNELDFIYRRRSVRKFLDTPVPDEVIQQLIDAAMHAPSGKNMQNWQFVVVRNKSIIQGMVKAVEEKHKTLLPFFSDEVKMKAFEGYVGYHTVFKNAPAVLLAYAGPYPFVADDLEPGEGLSAQEIVELKFANPAIQNIAAALQNFHLAATILGYGTCWMTGPTYAAKEISQLIGFHKAGYFLAAVSPLGIPDGKGASPPRRHLSEVLTIID